MPFALLTIGLLLIIVGFQNTYKAFGNQLVADFTGPNSFILYFIAIMAVGAIGYIKTLETFSRAMLGLIVIALFIGAVNKGGFFANFSSGINTGSSAPVNPAGGALPASGGGVSSGGGGGGGSDSGGGILGDIGKGVDIISSIAGFF